MGKETEVKDSELSGEFWEWWCRATKHDEEHLETKKEKDGWEGKREIERGSEGQVDAPTRHFPFFFCLYLPTHTQRSFLKFENCENCQQTAGQSRS